MAVGKKKRCRFKLKNNKGYSCATICQSRHSIGTEWILQPLMRPQVSDETCFIWVFRRLPGPFIFCRKQCLRPLGSCIKIEQGLRWCHTKLGRFLFSMLKLLVYGFSPFPATSSEAKSPELMQRSRSSRPPEEPLSTWWGSDLFYLVAWFVWTVVIGDL